MLLFVNGQASVVDFAEDYIKNGKRKAIVQSIPGADSRLENPQRSLVASTSITRLVLFHAELLNFD